MANLRITPIDTKEKKKKNQELRIVPINNYSSQNTTTKNVATNKNNDVRTVKTKSSLEINSDGYKDTGKTYGDYEYRDYAKRKDEKIYEKDGKYYYYNGKDYQDVTKNNYMSDIDGKWSKKEKEEAKKLGYKDNRNKKLTLEEQIKLDTVDASKKQKKEYEKDLERQSKESYKEYKRKNRVRKSGSGLAGSLGEIKNYISNATDKVDKEIVTPVKYAKDNYETGKLNNELALEYYKKMEGKKNNADKLAKQVEIYNSFNKDLLENPGAAGTAIQQANTQVEAIKNQGIAATLAGGAGAIIGGTIGGVTAGPAGIVPGAIKGGKLGAGAGYMFGSTPYTYKLEAGNQYQALTEMGVPDKIAKKYSRVTGGINAAIESAENLIDLATFGTGGKAAGAATKTVSKEVVEELVEDYGESTVKKWFKNKLGDEAADRLLNTVKTVGKSYVQNIGSEALEESLQESSSIAGERLAAKESGINRNISAKEDAKRIFEAGKSAAISSTFTSPIVSLGGSIATNSINQVQNIINQKNSGKITAQQANEMIQQVKEGTYEQNKTVDEIAQEKVNEIINNPNLNQGQKSDNIRAITQTVQQQRASIDSKTQNTVNNESLQQNNINNQETQKTGDSNKKTIDNKEKQFKIIKETNPMNDEYHTGIRNVNDIKTFEETINDEDSFNWGDFTREDAKKALKTGEIKIYSSKNIKNGEFVSTSYQQAYEYAGRDASKVKSKIVPLENVAWINGDEGQYAKVEGNKSNVKNNSSNYKYRVTDKTKSGKDVFNVFPAREEGTKPKLTSVEGKISTVDNIKVGTYFEEKTGKYVTVDLETGLKISDGKTQKSSINNADKTIKEKNSEGFDWNKTRENWFDRLKISKEDILNRDYLDIDTNIPIEEIVEEVKSIEELNRIEKIYEKEAENIEDSEKYQNRMEEILEIIDNKKEMLNNNINSQEKSNIFRENKYTKETLNNFKMKNIDVVNTYNDLKNIVQNVLDGKGNQKNYAYSTITDETKNRIETDIGRELFKNNQYSLIVNEDGIKHLRTHFQTSEEISNEILRTKEIIENYDSVSEKRVGSKTKLIFEKTMIDGNLRTVELISRKNNALNLITSFFTKKQKNRVSQDATSNFNGSPARGSISTDNISQNTKNVNDTSSVNSMQQNSSNDTIAEKKLKAEQILRIKEDGTATELSDTPRILDKMPKKSKEKSRVSENITDAQLALTNRNAELDRISKKTKNKMLKTETDRLGIAPAEAQQNIGDAQRNNDGVLYKNFTDKNGNKTSMSWYGIWDDVYDNGIKNSEMDEYLIAHLNIDRLNQGVDQFNIPIYESEDTIQELEEKHPEIKRIAENIWQYQKNQLQKKVDAGLVTKDSQEFYNENTPHYVRIQRDVSKKGSAVMSAFNGNITMKNTIQSVKGGIDDILPIREVGAEYEMQSTNAIRKNNVLKELAKSLDYGEDADKISLDGDLTINPELIEKNKDGSYTATFFKDGKAYQIPINEGIYESLAGQSQYKWENYKITKVPRIISSIQRGLLTDKNPIFMITNFFKDFGDAPLNSKYLTSQFLKNYPRAVADLFAIGKQKGFYARLYEALGGSDNSYFKDGKFVKESKSKVGKVVDVALKPIEVGNEFIEKLPRLTEFITTIESNGYKVTENGELVARKGKTPKKSSQEVLSEALYNAAEITTNFKRGGKLTKALNRNGATFLNASVQGFSKQVRNFTEIENPKQAVKLLEKAVILGVGPALLASAMYGGDKDYDDLPDYVKDEYFLFKGKDGKWVRIPRGRAVSVISSAFRHTMETIKGKEETSKAFSSWVDIAKTQIAPNSVFDSNVFAPIMQVKKNESWSGNKIVSDSLSNPTHPEEEYDAKTTSLSKWLGEKLHKSPKKIDYLIDQYSGGIGDIAQPFMTNYAESGDEGVANKIFVNPLKSKFTADTVYSNKTVSNFYDTMEKLEGNKKSSKATLTDKAKYSYIYSSSMGISELYKQQREIQNNTKLSDSEKYKQARDKQKEIIKAMKDAMDAVEKAKTDGDVVKVGQNYYRKKVEKDGTIKASKIRNVD